MTDIATLGGDVFKLVKLPDVVMAPVPTDQVAPAHFEGFDPDADHETARWTFRQILEMQRHSSLIGDLGGIGGFGQCTTISAEAVTHTILQRWPEDKLGTRLRPDPIDWTRWRRENPKPPREQRKPALRVVN